jgi:hypothetical protein
VAAGLTTHVVLLADAAGVDGTQREQLLLQVGEAPLNLSEIHHADSYIEAIGICQEEIALFH